MKGNLCRVDVSRATGNKVLRLLKKYLTDNGYLKEIVDSVAIALSFPPWTLDYTLCAVLKIPNYTYRVFKTHKNVWMCLKAMPFVGDYEKRKLVLTAFLPMNEKVPLKYIMESIKKSFEHKMVSEKIRMKTDAALKKLEKDGCIIRCRIGI